MNCESEPTCLSVCLQVTCLSLWIKTPLSCWELRGNRPDSTTELPADTVHNRTISQQNTCAPYQMSVSCNSRLVKKAHLLNYCMYVCICTTVVCADLTDSSMAPGGRGYQRLLTGLRSRLQLKTDFLLSHHPGESDIIRHGLD